MKRRWQIAAGCLAALGLVFSFGSIARGDDGDTDFYFTGRPFVRPCPCPCPCPTVAPGTAVPGTAPQGAASPGQPGAAPAQPGAAPSAENAPSNDLLAQQGAGVPGGPASAAPNMIGDFFGGGVITVGPAFGGAPNNLVNAPGGTSPRFKLADLTSPIPQDRAYFDYDYYHNVQLQTPNIDVNVYTPGFEKTFLDGLVSFELRLPMANTLSSNVFMDGTTATSVGEVGNLAMAFKGLLLRRDTFALSAGLALSVPTAKSTQIFAESGDPAPECIMVNESVHLMPFLGALWTPTDRVFAIGYVQLDVDANGDTVLATNGGAAFPSNPLLNVGRYFDPTILYTDFALGYWVHRSDSRSDLVTGLAYVGEIHVNQSLGTSSLVTDSAGGTVLEQGSAFTIIDLTVGAHVVLRESTTMTLAYCTPLTAQRQFDGEFQVLLDRRF